MTRQNTVNLVPDEYLEEFLKAMEYQAVRRKTRLELLKEYECDLSDKKK